MSLSSSKLSMKSNQCKIHTTVSSRFRSVAGALAVAGRYAYLIGASVMSFPRRDWPELPRKVEHDRNFSTLANWQSNRNDDDGRTFAFDHDLDDHNDHGERRG